MSVGSTEFLIGLLLLSAVFFYIPGIRPRQALLAVCNLFFLWTFIPNPASWAALFVFVLSGYLVALLLIRRPGKALFSAYMILLIGAFAWLKQYDFLKWGLPPNALHHSVAIVGLSYMLFRQIHFLVDAMQGQIPNPSLWTYLNYQLSFFTLLSGPIQRYQSFSECWENLHPVLADRHDILKAHLRILIGLIKLCLISALLLDIHGKFRGTLNQAGTGILEYSKVRVLFYFLAMMYVYPVYLYMNFSGYCDVVIGGGALTGMKIPENFDKPYLSRNMLDFWTRFHRTLGFWIRDYLFMPMYKSIAERSPKIAPSMAFLCYFVAFIAAGVWHGSTSNFFIFGLIQGIGAATVKLWDMFIVSKWGRSGQKRYMASVPIRIGAIFLTLTYYSISMLFFYGDLKTCMAPLQAVARAIR